MRFASPMLAAILLTTGTAFRAAAQDEADALRYSFLQPQGTARSIGFGSALGSVGGDFTSLSINPAGIGIYRKSELMFTPSLMFNNSDAGYNGNKRTDNGAHFSFSNAGIVWSYAAQGRRYERSPWKAVSFGLGINRLADFTRDYNYAGYNATSSASWVYEIDANNNPGHIDQPGSPANLGYDSYLLDTATLTNGQLGYGSVVNPTTAAPVYQNMQIKERGGISEMVFSLGGNYDERLMLGATLGLPVVNYHREKTYSESDANNAMPKFDNYRYHEDLKTEGIGINLKLGAIYKPNDLIRFGAAIHTPSAFALSDVQTTGISANTESFAGSVTVPDNENHYDYTLITPWRGILSGTVLLGKYGFITADYEYVDYKTMRYNFDDKDYQSAINDRIKAQYRDASNFRAGIELRFANLSLRGGFGFYGNPYKSSFYKDGERTDLSAGIGYRIAGTFVDLAFVHHDYKSAEQPYTLPGYNVSVPTANLQNAQNNVALTVGWKF